nr:unnamed protein product [Callosobruchus chinensis]
MEFAISLAVLLVSLVESDSLPVPDYQIMKNILAFYNECFKEEETFSQYALQLYVDQILDKNSPDINPELEKLLIDNVEKIKRISEVGEYMYDMCPKKGRELAEISGQKLPDGWFDDHYAEIKQTKRCLEKIVINYLRNDVFANPNIFGSSQRDPGYDIVTFYEECYEPKVFSLFAFVYDLTHPYVFPELLEHGNDSRVDRNHPVFTDLKKTISEEVEKKYLDCQNEVDKRLQEESDQALQLQIFTQSYCVRKTVDNYLLNGASESIFDYKNCYKNTVGRCIKPEPSIIGREG